MQDHNDDVYPSSGNVFADLGLPDPEVRLAKAQLAHVIRRRILEYGLNQTRAAERLAITQARVSEIMNGKVGKMSYELLLGYLSVLECDVQITIIPRRAEQIAANAQRALLVRERGHIYVGTP